MTYTETHNSAWRTVLTAALIVAVLGLTAAVAGAADTARSRLDRKVRVMERVLDEVLIQSPNVVVGLGGVTRGLVLEGYGALFTMDVSVGAEELLRVPERVRSRVRISGVPEPPPPPKPEPKPEPRPEHEESELVESWDEWQKQAAKRRQEQYDAFKVELIDALIDYGATLGELKDDRWIAVAAFLDGRQLLGGGDGGRLVVRAKMRDLRQHNAGSLSRDAVIQRVEIEER
jgi:hypothetical protein